MLSQGMLDEGRRLLAAAHGGPWRTEPSKYVQGRYVVAEDGWEVVHATGAVHNRDDAEFIVWARNHLLELLNAAGRQMAAEAPRYREGSERTHVV